MEEHGHCRITSRERLFANARDLTPPRPRFQASGFSMRSTEVMPADTIYLRIDILLLPRLIWMAHERRRDLARFNGLRFSTSMMFQSCFLAVAKKERMSAKSMAPSNDRKPPEIF